MIFSPLEQFSIISLIPLNIGNVYFSITNSTLFLFLVVILFLALFDLILLCFVIKQLPFFKESGIKIEFLWAVLLIKFLVSICLFFIYTYYYPDRITADIFKFFDDSIL